MALRTRSRSASADRNIQQSDSIQASAMPWSLRDPSGNSELLAIDGAGNIYSAGNDVNNLALAAINPQNATLTAAQLLGGIIEHTVTTGAGTDTTDTAANIDAALANPQVGDTFQCTLINTSASAFAITVAAGAGVTLKGSQLTIAQNKTGILTFRRTGAGAWTCYLTVSS